MRSISDISQRLAEQRKDLGLTQAALERQAGVSHRTLQQVFSGESDYKLSTLLALADRLDLEVMLVPKAAAYGLTKDRSEAAPVLTRVQAALNKTLKP